MKPYPGRPLPKRSPAVALAASLLFALGASSRDQAPERALDHEACAKRGRLLAARAKTARSIDDAKAVQLASDRGVDVLSYDIAFSIDPAVVSLEGRTSIRLVATGNDLASVPIDFDDTYAIDSLTRDGRPIVALSRGGGRLVLPLDPPLLRERRATLTIAYHGVPPAFSALEFWQHETGYAATTVAEPFDASSFWPCIDDPADRALTTVHITVPNGYVGASAGLSTVKAEPDGRKTWTWRLPEPIPTYLVSLNAARYEILEDVYTSQQSGRTMPLRSFLLPQHVAFNRGRLDSIRNHLDVLSELFGEYPFLSTKYGIVEGAFPGGMEHPTLTSIGVKFLGDPIRDTSSLFVHELAHQWWGDRVTMRTWDDIWLNEGFATYSEILYREKAFGESPGRLLASEYDDRLYDGNLAPRVVASATNPFAATGSVYRKGAYVLHMLRRLVGDPVFFDALKTYGDRHAFSNASRQDLRAVFEEKSGLDLKAFFDQWLETPFRPILRAQLLNTIDRTRIQITVTQTQTHAVSHPQPSPGDRRYYQLAVPLRLTYDNGSTADILLPAPSETTGTDVYNLPNPSPRRVTRIVIDSQGDLLFANGGTTVGG